MPVLVAPGHADPAVPSSPYRYLRWPTNVTVAAHEELRPYHYGDVQILIPMLASAGEIDQTLALLAQAKETLREQGVPFNSRVAVGGMIEIPAAVLAMDAFLKKLDFLSIGTNDLIQYTLAVDRADEAVSHLYDPLHPAVMRLISLAISVAMVCVKRATAIFRIRGPKTGAFNANLSTRYRPFGVA